YLPLDPGYPASRLTFMAQDAGATVLLTGERTASTWAHATGHRVVWEQNQEAMAHEPTTAPVTSVQPDNLAYVIYTSGSTGRPKGTAITHGALSNHMQWMAHAFPLDGSDTLLQKTPLSFDASVWEVFAPLLAGARLALAKPDGHRDPAYLWDRTVDLDVTTLQLVP